MSALTSQKECPPVGGRKGKGQDGTICECGAKQGCFSTEDSLHSRSTQAFCTPAMIGRAIRPATGRPMPGRLPSLPESSLTAPLSSGMVPAGAENSYEKVASTFKHGSFFMHPAHAQAEVHPTAISGREWTNKKPFGEYVRRSRTVFDSRPFLRSMGFTTKKLREVHHAAFPSFVPRSAAALPSVFHLF